MMSEQPHNYTLSLAGMGQIGQIVDSADDPLGTGSKTNSEQAIHSDNTPSPLVKQSSNAMQRQMMDELITPEFALEELKHQSTVVMVGDGEEKVDIVPRLTDNSHSRGASNLNPLTDSEIESIKVQYVEQKSKSGVLLPFDIAKQVSKSEGDSEDECNPFDNKNSKSMVIIRKLTKPGSEQESDI